MRGSEPSFFKDLTDAAHDAVIVVDRAGLISTWNTAAGRMFGYGPDDVLGQPATNLVADAQDTADGVPSLARWTGSAYSTSSLTAGGATGPLSP